MTGAMIGQQLHSTMAQSAAHIKQSGHAVREEWPTAAPLLSELSSSWQVYMDSIRDLLFEGVPSQRPKLEVKQGPHGSHLPGLTELKVRLGHCRPNTRRWITLESRAASCCMPCCTGTGIVSDRPFHTAASRFARCTLPGSSLLMQLTALRCRWPLWERRGNYCSQAQLHGTVQRPP